LRVLSALVAGLSGSHVDYLASTGEGGVTGGQSNTVCVVVAGRHRRFVPYRTPNNESWVSVADTADTAEFAVESLRRWWRQMGAARFAHATRLLVTGDGGGSNGSRVRTWKKHLAAFAAETGLHITVCHSPPGTSKWNKIEHRMFSFITNNWRTESLTSIRTIVELIAHTTTTTGLTIQAAYDPNWYPTGVNVHRHRTRRPTPEPPRLARRLELHPRRRRTPPTSRVIPRRALSSHDTPRRSGRQTVRKKAPASTEAADTDEASRPDPHNATKPPQRPPQASIRHLQPTESDPARKPST
jgi:hypothetical protein